MFGEAAITFTVNNSKILLSSFITTYSIHSDIFHIFFTSTQTIFTMHSPSPPSRVDGSQLFNLITEANGHQKAARESQNLNDGRKLSKYLQTLTKAAEYFPRGTFSTELDDKAGFFQDNSLLLHTELC